MEVRKMKKQQLDVVVTQGFALLNTRRLIWTRKTVANTLDIPVEANGCWLAFSL
jgi:hypothetical protein